MVLFRAHVLVSGRVQGVFFRESTRRCAEALGLSGFVRNLSDGRVEALFSGEEEAVHRALDFVRRGPPGAQVTDVHVDLNPPPADADEGSTEFRIQSAPHC